MVLLKPLPTLRQLRHLIALAREEHFGRAAERCLVTQSTLSASIKELESVLGQTLVERTKRVVIVTPLGEAVVERAKGVLRDVEDIVDLITATSGVLSGDLRLGIIPTISPFLLPRVLPALRSAHPNLRLYLHEKQSADLVRDLNAGEIDVALMAFPYDCGPAKIRIFADDPFLVAFPRDHALAGRETIGPDDLADEDLLLLEEGHCLRDHILSACQLPIATTSGGFQAASLHTLVQMVDNGLGITLLPKMAVDAGITKGTRIAVRPFGGQSASRRIGFVWRSASPRAAEFDALSAFFRDELGTPIPGMGHA